MTIKTSKSHLEVVAVIIFLTKFVDDYRVWILSLIFHAFFDI